MTEKMTPEDAAKASLFAIAPVLPYGRNTQLAQFIPPCPKDPSVNKKKGN